MSALPTAPNGYSTGLPLGPLPTELPMSDDDSFSKDNFLGDGFSAITSAIGGLFGGGKDGGEEPSSTSDAGAAFPTEVPGPTSGVFPPGGNASPTGDVASPGGDDAPPSGLIPSGVFPPGGAFPTGSSEMSVPAPTEPATLPSSR
jgi:hypothetical protein